MGRKSKIVRLNVFFDSKLVGRLERSSSGEISFKYHKNWLENPKSFPISYSLLLREEGYRGAVVSSYFDNLLPDNENIRKTLALRTGSIGTSSIDLLSALGRDCVGALQFFSESVEPDFLNNINAKTLTDSEIADILRNLKKIPLGVSSSDEFRISIAGVQEKTALLYHNNKWNLPIGSTPTSHIIKVPLGLLPNGIDLSTSVENEWICLKVAEHLGLEVNKAEIHNFEDIKCLVVERFDRQWSTNKQKLSRIPQEDLCQALSVPSTKKYEVDGGPGIYDCMHFLNASDLRNQDRYNFFLSQIVFFLLGAIDGHAKNFSIFLKPTGFQLTPLYDIISVVPALKKRQLERKEIKLAMCIGESRHYKIDEMKYRHFEQTALRCGFPKQKLEEMLDKIIVDFKSLDKILNTLPPDYPKDLAEAIVSYAEKQLKKLTTL